MLPLKDLNPTRRVPFVTFTLIAINVVVFLWEQTQSTAELQETFLQLSVVPAQVLRAPFALDTVLDFFRSMFFHGGWLHLLSNMLYLWLFGDNLEDRLGVLGYIGFYFLCGFAAATAQILINPESTIPMVGASGAIAGVLGGYLLLFPRVRVQGIILLGLFSRFASWPAWAVLGLWFVTQLFSGVMSLGVTTTATGGVAFFAHIGGFVAGLLLIAVFMLLFPQPPAEKRREMAYDWAERYRY